MVEAVLGLHARNDEPDAARTGPIARVEDDSGGGGPALGRLLAVATLTPAQAALLATDVVDQLELAHSRGIHPIRLRGHAVRVSESGELTIECTGTAGSWDEVRDAATELLRQITRNCRNADFADRVDEAIAGSSDLVGLARRVRHAAAKEFDPAQVERKRRQIAALVATVEGHARLEDTVADRTDISIPVSPVPPTERHSAPPMGKTWHRKRRRPFRRRGLLALLAALVLVGLGWVAPTAWVELKEGWQTLLGSGEPAMDDRISPVSLPPEAPPPTEPGVAAGPVDIALPGSAGPIKEVTATFANGGCEPGGTCAVRADVGLDPAANIGAVTWNLTVYDRCTGETRPGADITVPVSPGAPEAYGIGIVDLPPGSALAVAAVTTVPVAVASQPVYVPAETATCPPGGSGAGG